MLLPGGMKNKMLNDYNEFSDEKKNKLQSDSAGFYAGLSGSKQSQDITKKKMKELSEVYLSDKDPVNRKFGENLLNLSELSSNDALLNLSVGLSTMPKGIAIMDAVNSSKNRQQETVQHRADLVAKGVTTAIKKIGFDIAKVAKERSNKGLLPVDKIPAAETDLRKEFTKNSKTFTSITEAFSRVKASQETGPGDISLIFNFMKMLDPSSVVREAEFATAANSSGIPDAIRNLYNKALNGERLTKNQRKTMTKQTEKIWDASKVENDKIRSGVTRIAKTYGLNPNNIFFESEGATKPGVLPSTIVDAQQPVVDRNIVVDF